MWLIRAIVRLRKQALSALPVHQCLSGCLVLGPAFGAPLWPSVIEPWAKSCKKKVSTLYSLGATFKLRPHSWFLLDKHLQPCIWLTSGSWIEFLSRPWTCLLSMDISGVLDPGYHHQSSLLLAWLAETSHDWSQHQLHTPCREPDNLLGWPQVVLEISQQVASHSLDLAT